MRISDWSSDVCSSDLDPHHEVISEEDSRLAEQGAMRGQVCNLGRYIWLTVKEGGYGSGFQVGDMLLQCLTQEVIVGSWFSGEADLLQINVVEPFHGHAGVRMRSEEHTSELPSLMRRSYAISCMKKQKKRT